MKNNVFISSLCRHVCVLHLLHPQNAVVSAHACMLCMCAYVCEHAPYRRPPFVYLLAPCATLTPRELLGAGDCGGDVMVQRSDTHHSCLWNGSSFQCLSVRAAESLFLLVGVF